MYYFIVWGIALRVTKRFAEHRELSTQSQHKPQHVPQHFPNCVYRAIVGMLFTERSGQMQSVIFKNHNFWQSKRFAAVVTFVWAVSLIWHIQLTSFANPRPLRHLCHTFSPARNEMFAAEYINLIDYYF